VSNSERQWRSHILSSLAFCKPTRRAARSASREATRSPGTIALFDSPFERRRLKILNAIFVALSHEDYKPSIQGKEARNLGVTIGKQHVSFDLDGASQKKPEGWRMTSAAIPKFGTDEKLRMEISHSRETPEMQWSWLDGDQKLETQLTEIVVGLIYAGEIQYRAGGQSTYEWQVERQQHRREERRRQRKKREAAIPSP